VREVPIGDGTCAIAAPKTPNPWESAGFWAGPKRGVSRRKPQQYQ
jgi:hypothetical protein